MKLIRVYLALCMALVLGFSPVAAIVGCAPTNNYVAVFKGPVTDVKAFGVKGDSDGASGGTDDTVAIQAAIDSVTAANNPVIYFPPARGYRVTAAITVPINVSVIMDGPIIYTGSSNIAVLTIGATVVSNVNQKYKLNVRRNTVSDWTSESNIGIKIFNASRCDIEIVQADGFTIGAQFMGDGAGFSYNHVKPGYIYNNKIGFDLTNKNTGWCNENEFLGGSFGGQSSGYPLLTRYGVRITSADGTYVNNNNNVFLKPSMELWNPANSTGTTSSGTPTITSFTNTSNWQVGDRIVHDASIPSNTTITDITGSTITISQNATASGSVTVTPPRAFGFQWKHANNNTVYSPRLEGNAFAGEALNASGENAIIGAFQAGSATNQYEVLQTGTVFGNYVSNQRALNTERIQRQIFDSGDLSRNWSPFDATNIMVRNMSWRNVSGGALFKAITSITPGSNYLDFSRGLGVAVDTSQVKEFVLMRSAVGLRGGRVAVICFNAAGTQLTTASAGSPFVQTTTNGNMTYVTDFGGSWKTGTDHSAAIYFKVTSDVDSIWVGVLGGSASAQIKRIRLFTAANIGAASYGPMVSAGHTGTNPDQLTVTQSPQTSAVGTWEVGKVFLNDAPATGAPIGWRCTTAGTPGTWEALQYGATATANTWALAQTMTTPLAVTSGGTGSATAAFSGANITALNATQLTTGTLPDARFPATLPAASGVNLTALNASNLASGTIPDARFPASLPAVAGTSLTGVAKTGSGNALTGDQSVTSGDIVAASIGKGFKVKEGSNARMGTGTLTGGAVTIANTTVTANTRVYAFRSVGAGTRGLLEQGTLTPGTSFVVNSVDSSGSLVADTSTFNWLLIEPAP